MKKDLVTLQKEFVNLRNGAFIHFNSATQQFCDSDVHDWDYGITDKNDKNRHVFDPQTWNPNQLNCAQWAKVAKDGQAKFAALTAKHHEGFTLWATKTTEHSIHNGTFKVDVVKEYLHAFREAGILAGLYFSILDLHHGITETSCTKEDVQFIKAQIKELLTNYGEIPFLIIDGWNAPWGGPRFSDLPFSEIDSFVKKIQPNCLVMNIGSGEDIQSTDIVFYENAAGEEAEDDFVGPGASCNIYTKTWFWKEGYQTETLKPAAWAVEKVEECNAKNISFLMNISPNKYGTVDDNLAQRFHEFGELYKECAPLEELPEGWLYR
ncbi:alpha-L-fucosidase [Enterococcus sp. AZ194]|uniref:alpha-L-fucosidase n=1 Tax=Enterococcus sp. AZ194 TaxID=2774629 RepID=UPI003F26DB1D